jgi:hypothetical protein
VAFATLVDASEDRIDNAQRSSTLDASARNTVSGAPAAVDVGGGLEPADHRCPDCDDAAAFGLRLFDRRHGPLWDPVLLIERKLQIERRISGRRNPSSDRERRETDAASPPGCKRAPVERKAG